MTIFVDADACPVTRLTEEIAKKHSIPVMLLCDTNHVLTSDYSEVRIVGAGADAVDLALINLCKSGDIVVTQDYGVAALALGKGAKAIHQSGRWYTEKNIDALLMERHLTDDPEIVREIRQCDLLPGMNFEASKEATDTEDCAIKRRQTDIFHGLLHWTIEHSNPENLIDTPMLA